MLTVMAHSTEKRPNPSSTTCSCNWGNQVSSSTKTLSRWVAVISRGGSAVWMKMLQAVLTWLRLWLSWKILLTRISLLLLESLTQARRLLPLTLLNEELAFLRNWSNLTKSLQKLTSCKLLLLSGIYTMQIIMECWIEAKQGKWWLILFKNCR